MNGSHRSAALRIAFAGAAVFVLWLTFRDVDVTALGTLLDDTAVVVALVVVPFAAVNLVDAKGWQWSLDRLGARVRIGDVFAAQLAGEAAILSLPFGFAISEPLRPVLLGQRAAVPIDTAIASTLARKTFLVLAEGVVVGLACALGARTFHDVSREVLGCSGLEWLTGCAAVLLCGMGCAMASMLGRGALATRALGALRKVTRGRVLRFLDEREDRFTGTDRALQGFFATSPVRLLPGLGWYVAVWLLEALEAYVVLRVLGAPVSFVEALSMEAVLSFLRSLLVVLPAGLGVQDLGYVLFLRALGVSDPLVIGAAFSIIKRGKEALWIAVGYGCVLVSRRRPMPGLAEAAA